jgi:hypothetical protein
VLKSAVGIPYNITLYQGSSFRMLVYGIIPFYIASFSIRKSEVNIGVVVITMF